MRSALHPEAHQDADGQTLLPVATRLLAGQGPGHVYTRELAVAALLDFTRTIPGQPLRSASLDFARRLRPAGAGTWEAEPFGSLTWTLAESTRDAVLTAGFIAATATMVDHAPRDAAGVFVHPRGATRGGGHAVLLDSGVEQICRLARATARSGDPRFADECRFQLAQHRNLLRLPGTGLWCQGRGWLTDPAVFSPGAWSRGHGWLLRGLVDGARVLPPGDLREALREVIAEVVAALLPLQDEAGCWRALLTRPSAPEISGTALIAGALARAAHAGLVPAEPALVAAQRALPTVLAQIDAAGVVHGVCPGPGPLSTEEPWLAPSFLPDDPHGPLAVLDLAAALLP